MRHLKPEMISGAITQKQKAPKLGIVLLIESVNYKATLQIAQKWDFGYNGALWVLGRRVLLQISQ